MLGIVHNCNPSARPQIDYSAQFAAIIQNIELILAEARNHNQTVAIDWEPVLSKMQLLAIALQNIQQSAVEIGAAQLAAAEKINSNFIGLARSITDFQSATMEASAALLKAETDQTAVLQQMLLALQKPPKVAYRRYTAHYRASASGGLITIPAGTYELQINPMGCYLYTANGDPQEKGHVILHGGKEGHLNHKWELELPPHATMRLDYDAPEDFQPLETVNVNRLTLADLASDDPDCGDDVLARAIADASSVINSES